MINRSELDLFRELLGLGVSRVRLGLLDRRSVSGRRRHVDDSEEYRLRARRDSDGCVEAESEELVDLESSVSEGEYARRFRGGARSESLSDDIELVKSVKQTSRCQKATAKQDSTYALLCFFFGFVDVPDLSFASAFALSASFAFKILSANPTPLEGTLNSSGTWTLGVSRFGPPPIASCLDWDGRGLYGLALVHS